MLEYPYVFKLCYGIAQHKMLLIEGTEANKRRCKMGYSQETLPLRGVD